MTLEAKSVTTTTWLLSTADCFRLVTLRQRRNGRQWSSNVYCVPSEKKLQIRPLFRTEVIYLSSCSFALLLKQPAIRGAHGTVVSSLILPCVPVRVSMFVLWLSIGLLANVFVWELYEDYTRSPIPAGVVEFSRRTDFCQSKNDRDML